MRRGGQVAAQRQDRIKCFAQIHEQGAGRRAAEEERAEHELNERYVAAKREKDDQRARSKASKRQTLNAKIKLENDSQLQARLATRLRADEQRARDLDRANDDARGNRQTRPRLLSSRIFRTWKRC